MYVIDQLRPDEVSEVAKIYEDSWKFAYRGILPDDFLNGIVVDNWIPYLSRNPEASRVLRVDDRAVATISFGPARDWSRPGWGEIVSIYVRPESERKGYGSALLRYAVNDLRSRGYDRIYIWTLEQNRKACAFYEKEGFSYSGNSAETEIGGKKLAVLRYERDFRVKHSVDAEDDVPGLAMI